METAHRLSYEKSLGGKIEGSMTHGQSPMADQVAPEWKDNTFKNLSEGANVTMPF
jgi:hypothetical protein